MKQIFLLVLLYGIFIKINDINCDSIDGTKNFNDNIRFAIKNTYSKDVCARCEFLMDQLIALRRGGTKDEQIKQIALTHCPSLSGWNEQVCKGFINIEADVVLYIIDNKNDLTSERICSIFLQRNGCKDPNRIDWDVVLPPELNSNEIIHKISIRVEDDVITTEDNIKILHLTDIHFDPLYKPESNSKCDLELCCQESSGKPNSTSSTAGFWGDYNVCDMPWHSVQNVLQQIKIQHPKIDLIYYTGDIISHRSWDTNITSNSESISKLYNKLGNVFGSVPIFPVLGNHEPHPTDFWSPKKIGNDTDVLSTKWLFELIADEWSQWLPESAQVTLKKGGYYTVLLPKKLRIIGLNSNVCYTANLWLFYDDKDPYNQLQWLVDILESAEQAGESVHILSHVPPGHVQCLANWNDVYNKIVARFAHIIKAQFNGHTHWDEFRLHYNEIGTEVINVAFNGGSFTTFVGFNPNYRIYDVNPKNYMVNDYEQWTYNMSAANADPDCPPDWYKLYSFKEAYGMKSLSLEEFGRLQERMAANTTLMQEYYRYQVRDSDVLMEKGCSNDCLKAKLCAIKSTKFEDAFLCKDN